MMTSTRLSAWPVLVSSFLCFTCFFYVQEVDAQVSESWGKEFKIAWLQSLGGGGPTETPALRLYLNSSLPADVRLINHMASDTVNVTLPGSYEMVTVELEKIMDIGLLLDQGDQGVTNQVLSVSATRPISLQGANILVYSADAFLGLPVESGMFCSVIRMDIWALL